MMNLMRLLAVGVAVVCGLSLVILLLVMAYEVYLEGLDKGGWDD
jgi:hypothetical protein